MRCALRGTAPFFSCLKLDVRAVPVSLAGLSKSVNLNNETVDPAVTARGGHGMATGTGRIWAAARDLEHSGLRLGHDAPCCTMRARRPAGAFEFKVPVAFAA